MHAAGGGRWHRGDVVAAIISAHDRPDDGPIALQVVASHDAAVAAHACDDLLSERAFVERTWALCRNRLERTCKIGLHQPIAKPQRLALALQKDLCRRGPARETRLRARQRV